MSLSGINSVNGNHQHGERVDQRELEVAKKLVAAGIISSVQEFQNLTEAQKQAKVQEYNKSHPNSPIGEKSPEQIQPSDNTNKGSDSGHGSEMSKFFNDVDWKKIKLE